MKDRKNERGLARTQIILETRLTEKPHEPSGVRGISTSEEEVNYSTTTGMNY